MSSVRLINSSFASSSSDFVSSVILPILSISVLALRPSATNFVSLRTTSVPTPSTPPSIEFLSLFSHSGADGSVFNASMM